MNNNNNGSGRSQRNSSRPNFSNNNRSGGRSSGGFNSNRGYQGGRNRNGGGFNRSNGGNSRRGGKRFQGQNIDISMFIRKAETKVEDVYKPIHNFSDFALNPTLKENVISKGYVVPTPIQDQIIDLIIEGKDVIGIANTGTGKTAAFLLPLITKIANNPNEKALIIVPTRELAVQIKDEYTSFIRGINSEAVLCIGGADIRKQMGNLRRRHNFVIGTPGRLKDLSNRRALNIGTFNNIVLDEVDRMLDMGFLEDITFLIEQMSERRQSLFFSATMQPKLARVAEAFLRDPITITVKTQETSANVDQNIIRVLEQGRKADTLHDLLIKEDFKKVLIFARTKHGVDKLHEDLFQKGHKVESIHGDKSQFKRQKALDNFKKDRSTILIATDVAARGLDIPNVSHVINFDVPATYEDYVHRIGRTGRGDKKGIALTFVD